MTTKERATVQAFINKLSELDSIESETLKTLQDMCEAHGDGPKPRKGSQEAEREGKQ